MLFLRRKFVNLSYRYHHQHRGPKSFTFPALWVTATATTTALALILLCTGAILIMEKDKIMEDGNEEYLIRSPQEEHSQEFDNIWTRISDSVHIYSAHLDSRYKTGNLTLVRIIAIKRVPSMRSVIQRNPLDWLRIKDETNFEDKYTCKLYITQDDKGGLSSFEIVTGDVVTYKIIEEGVKTFAFCYINCYSNSTKLTKAFGTGKDVLIALYPLNVRNYPDKLIRVETEMLKVKPKEFREAMTLGLCVRPLFGPMDDLAKVVEFVSYYHAMGVKSMTFYDLSISPRIRKYLKDLTRLGGMSVHLNRWNLPTGNMSELWDYGSLAALNDCLFKRMGDGHVIFVDIDEFIVPQRDKLKNLHDLINLTEKTHPHFQELLIRNAFFCQEFCHNNTHKRRKKSESIVFTIAQCTTRTKRILNVSLRSKFIVKPQKVISVGHHMVTKFVVKGDPRFVKNSVVAGIDVAILNHYRSCESIYDGKHPIFNRLTVVDNKLLRFLKGITNQMPFLIYSNQLQK